MQIHELNAFLGALNAGTFLAVDDGDDTGRLSIEALLRTVNERIDHIITSPAPTEQEIIDARRGWNEVVYGSLGTAIRSQVKQILAQFYKFNTYDLLAVYGTPISRTRNGVTFTWDDAGQVCEVSGEAVGGDAYASIYTQTGAWPGIFEHGVVYTVGYETTDQNVKLRIAVWEGVETTPDYYYFDEDGHFGIPPEAAKISIDLWVASGDTVSAVVKNVCMLRTYTAKEVTATIRDAMIGADRHMYNSLGDAIREQLNGKVDKVTGKVLSTNDFTDADKTKLDDVEAGAEVNAIEAIKLDGTELTPDENRAVNIPVDETLTAEGVPADAKTVGEELETKANVDGYYETLTSGQTEQIIATEAITDTEPYNYRKTGGPNDVGDRVYDTLVGGSVVWNQLVANGDFSNELRGWSYDSGWTASNNIATITAPEDTTGYIRRNVPFVLGHKHLVMFELFQAQATTNYLTVGFNYASSGTAYRFDSRLLKDDAVNTWISKGYILDVQSDSADGLRFAWLTTAPIIAGETVKLRNVMVIDLTAAVTPTIADYIYSLEQTTAGAGVAWFKKYFPEVYYGFAEPHFEHVQVSAKNTVGFNQFDKDNANKITGGYFNGNVIASGSSGRAVIYVPCFPNTTYCASRKAAQTNERFYIGYTNELPARGVGVYGVTSAPSSQTVGNTMTITTTTGANAKYIALWAFWDGHTEALDTLCINLHSDRDGEYEAYRKRTYPIEPKVLRGILKLDASNRPYFDGDVMRHDGSGERNIRELTIDGTESEWMEYPGSETVAGYLYAIFPVDKRPKIQGASGWGVCDKMTTVGNIFSEEVKGTISTSTANNGKNLYFSFPEGVNSLADFKTWLASNNLHIYYILETPEPFTAEPYQSPMVVDPLGTEEFVDYGVEQGDRDVAIPVGHKSEYPPDLRGKLQHLPGLSSSGDGRYVVVQTGTQMSLTPDTSLGLIAALEARVAALEGGN